jgi:hypothetical protein
MLGKSKRLPKVLRKIMYGMTGHEMDLELRRERGSRDMEEKSFEGERPDRLCGGGYWIGGKIHEERFNFEGKKPERCARWRGNH